MLLTPILPVPFAAGLTRQSAQSRCVTEGLNALALHAMALLLGELPLFSVRLPAPILELIQRAAGIIGGKP